MQHDAYPCQFATCVCVDRLSPLLCSWLTAFILFNLLIMYGRQNRSIWTDYM